MANKELNRLVESYFTPHPEENIYGIDALEKMISEVYRTSMLLGERSAPPAGHSGAMRTYTIQEIPLIPISELGWANNDQGSGDTSQRAQLENWLRNIQGSGFEEKLSGVTQRMESGFADPPKDNNLSAYIQEVMSYLVFLKTLTMAITNFNASAAGFNFEAFLGALMGGHQIPASGAKTIADFVAEMGEGTVPISLKLYTEGQLKVGGSYFDLSNDLIEPKAEWSTWAAAQPGASAMRYLVCTKDFDKDNEDPLARSGQIRFYQFDITRGNVFTLMAGASDKGRKCVASEENFMRELSQWDKTRTGPVPDLKTRIPAKKEFGDSSEVAEMWAEYNGDQTVATLSTIEGIPDPALAAPAFQAILGLYRDTVDSADGVNNIGKVSQIKNALRVSIYGSEAASSSRSAAGHQQNSVIVPMVTVIGNSFKDFKENVVKKSDKRMDAMNEMTWLYGGSSELLSWYESLSDEAKAIALSNTRGYILHSEWEIPNGKAISYGGGAPFATLSIGAPYVQSLLDKVRNEVMNEVFGIFERMQIMSEKLNSFFARGLEDNKEALRGAEAGEAAATSARKFAAE